MEVKLLNGGTAKLRLNNKQLRSAGTSKSKFQYGIGQQLQKEYPHDRIFEEVIVPVENIVLDFFIPSIGTVVECHGRQHVEHVPHFHRTKHAFNEQTNRDQKKRDWCELNGFRLVEIYA